MTYPGGKNGGGAYQRIINFMPPHDTYVELFLGSGAVIRNKKPADRNIGVDLSKDAIELACNLAGDRDDIEWYNMCSYRFLNDCAICPRTLFYIDPPYLPETRKSGKLYDFELVTEEHFLLLEIINSLPCMVMLSGYRSALYDKKLSNWHRVDYKAVTRQGMVDEALWMNFEPPKELHDYRYLGDNFRERERIKRKKERWKSQLEKMDRLERLALIDAMNST